MRALRLMFVVGGHHAAAVRLPRCPVYSRVRAFTTTWATEDSGRRTAGHARSARVRSESWRADTPGRMVPSPGRQPGGGGVGLVRRADVAARDVVRGAHPA